MRKPISSMILASVALSMGCSFIARGEDQYRTYTGPPLLTPCPLSFATHRTTVYPRSPGVSLHI